MTETERREELIAGHIFGQRCYMADTAAAIRSIFGDQLANATVETVMSLESVLYDHGFIEQADRISKMLCIDKIVAFWMLEHGYNEYGFKEVEK